MDFQDWLDEVTLSVQQNYKGDVTQLMADNYGRLSQLYRGNDEPKFVAQCLIENTED